MLRFRVSFRLCGFLLVLHGLGSVLSVQAGAQTPDANETNVSIVAKKSTLPASSAMVQPSGESVIRKNSGQVTKTLVLPTKSAPQPGPALSARRNKASIAPTESKAQTNLADRVVSLDLPLKFQTFYLGDVAVRIGAGGEVQVKISALKEPLKKIMKPETVMRLASRAEHTTQDSDSLSRAEGVTEVAKKAPGSSVSATLVNLFPKLMGYTSAKEHEAAEGAAEKRESVAEPEYMSLAEIKQRGIDIRYDPLASELSVAPSIEQRRDGNLSFAQQNEVPTSANAQKPAFFSAYLNTRMSMDYVSQSISTRTGLDAPNFDFDGAMRVGSIVLESESLLTPRATPSFGNEIATAYDFSRRGTRLVYDDPGAVVRYEAGDISPGFASFQSAPDLLGFSAERSYSQLRPGQNIRPTGQHTFRIDRPSNIDILVDGGIIRRIRLQPGNYNINDLPLKPGANKITLTIEDDTGAHRTLEFTNFGAQDLLAPGVNEWQIAGGIQSSLTGNAANPDAKIPVSYLEPDYLWKQPIMTGYYRSGITPSLTANAHAQGDTRVGMAGGGLSADTAYGYISLDLAGSFQATNGMGFAASTLYELANLRDAEGRTQSFRLSAEYQSSEFRTVNDYAAPPNYAVNLAALYSRDLSEDMSASLNGTLYLSRDALSNINGWDADLTVSKRFSDVLSGALSFGYGGDSTRQTHDVSCVCQSIADYQGLRAFARLNYRPSASTSLLFSEDAQTQTSRATYSYSQSATGGPWNVLVDAAHEGTARSADVDASVGYSANRGDVELSHATRIDGLSPGALDPRSTDERTTLRVESGIATADGAWSFGRPIHNSFAIVEPHETLGDRDLSLGPKDKETGHNDWLAPAMVNDINPYVQRRVEFDVDNLPVGYDLGAGAFDFLGPYKSGYRVQAGSAYTVTAIGTLLGEDGREVSLVAGTAKEISHRDGREVQLFTNRVGRFGAQGLAPGEWLIEIATEPKPMRFLLEIPDGTTGLYQAGVLKPQSK